MDMLISEQKPMEEILSYLSGEEKVFIVGCRGCAEGCQTGGEKQALEMKQKLEGEGKKITGISLIDFACNEQLTRMTLQAHESKVLDSDSLLMLCCGIGVQAAASVVDRVVHPGCNTVSLGGRHGEWRDGERCQECGQSVDGKGEVSGDLPIHRPAARSMENLLGTPGDGADSTGIFQHALAALLAPFPIPPFPMTAAKGDSIAAGVYHPVHYRCRSLDANAAAEHQQGVGVQYLALV